MQLLLTVRDTAASCYTIERIVALIQRLITYSSSTITFSLIHNLYTRACCSHTHAQSICIILIITTAMSCRARPSSLSARPPPKSPAREGRRRPVHSSRGGPPPRAVNRGRCEQLENRCGAVMRSRQGAGMAAAAWHLGGFGGSECLLLPHLAVRAIL